MLTSSTEAECHAFEAVGKEVQWQRDHQSTMGVFKVDDPTTIHEDNTGCESLAAGQGTYHKRSKHFGLEWYRAKERVAEGQIRVEHTPTEEQLADFFTKPLGVTTGFNKHRGVIMGDDQLQEYFGKLEPPKMTDEEQKNVAAARQAARPKRKQNTRRQ